MTRDAAATADHVGRAIAARRRDLGLSQRIVAERAQVSVALVQSIESGRSPVRRVLPRNQDSIAQVLGWPPGSLGHLDETGELPAPVRGPSLADIDPSSLIEMIDATPSGHEVPPEVRDAAFRVLARVRRALTDAEFDAWVRGVQSSRDHADGTGG